MSGNSHEHEAATASLDSERAGESPTPEALVAEARTRALEIEARTPESFRVRVLAVEPDPGCLSLLVHHLSNAGYDVSSAADGLAARALVRDIRPHVVVSAWSMPGIDGIDLCKTLHNTSQGFPTHFLILTSDEEELRVQEAFQAGADDCVAKPINPAILLTRVRTACKLVELMKLVERDRQLRDRQVAEMAVLNRKLESAAMTDVLTKLPNRRFATRKLEDEADEAIGAGSPLSLVMIDIDHFKMVNDRFGHDVGDLVIRETAQVLRASTPKGCYVCRYGGEEFLLICTRTTLADAAALAERVRAAVETHTIGLGFNSSVTVSMGVASLTCGPTNVDQLLKLADERVYLAKSAGRNRVVAAT